jgi:hypothetical protein
VSDRHTGGANAVWCLNALGYSVMLSNGPVYRPTVIAHAEEQSSDEERRANARLMAAAPKMLRVLRRIRAELDVEQAVSIATYDEIVQALSKATGEPA